MTSPYELVWEPPHPAEPPPASVRRAALAGLVVLLLGAPAGLLWARLAPSFPVSFSASGPSVENFDDGVFFAVDGTFLVVAALAGVLSGLLAWGIGRGHGPRVAVALAGGSLAAAHVARTVGERVVLDGQLRRFCAQATDNALCSLYAGSPELRSTGLVVVWSIAALITFSVVTLLTER